MTHGDGQAAQDLSGIDSPRDAAVLALLIEQPGHGYELLQRLDDRFGDLVPAASTQIYRTLSGLERSGLIEPMRARHRGKTRSVPYRATRAGARVHRGWLAQELRRDAVGEELVRRLLRLTIGDAGALLELVHRYEQACIDEGTALPVPTADRADDSPAAGFALLVEQLLAELHRIRMEGRLRFLAFARQAAQAEMERAENQTDEP